MDTPELTPDAILSTLHLQHGDGWSHDPGGPDDLLTFRWKQHVHHDYYNPYKERDDRDPNVLLFRWTVFVGSFEVRGETTPHLQADLHGTFRSYGHSHGRGDRHRYSAIVHNSDCGHPSLLGALLEETRAEFWDDVDEQIRHDGRDPSTMRRLAGLEGSFKIRKRRRHQGDQLSRSDEHHPQGAQTEFAFST